MAVKKTTKKADESAAPAQAEAKETAPKPKATKTKAAAPKDAAPAEASESKSAPKKAAPKASASGTSTGDGAKASAPKKAAAAPIKLTPPQGELLKKIGSAAEPGYTAEKSAEERSIKSLMDKKLVRKGAKDKATGKVPYTLTVAGKKHVG